MTHAGIVRALPNGWAQAVCQCGWAGIPRPPGWPPWPNAQADLVAHRGSS